MINYLFLLISCGCFSIILLFLFPKHLYKIYQIFSLLISGLMFLFSLIIWINFNRFSLEFQYILYYPWINSYNINLIFGIDGISLFFILLTTVIIPFCILAAWDIPQAKLLIIYLIIIELLLILTFSVLDLFLFCLFFESLLIPIFFIILLWGGRERKVVALTYFFIYTLFGSIFLILALFILYFEFQTTSFFALITYSMNYSQQLLVWVLLFIVFAIKVPIVPFHIWLPEAHVEAPTVGSVILASLLLKLGGYGIIRFLFLFEDARFYFQPFVITLCIISILFSSIIAIRQLDIKRIIAYSSIAHINFALLGYFSNTIYGIIGGIILIISHGIVSGALFLLVGIIYDRHHTRLIYYYGGLVQTIPLFSVFLFLFIVSNFSFPGTSNFIGELLVLIGLGIAPQKQILIIAGILLFFSLVYSIFLFNRIIFGNVKIQYIITFFDVNRREFYLLLPLLLLNIIIGLIPNSIITTIYLAVKNLVYLADFSPTHNWDNEISPWYTFIFLLGTPEYAEYVRTWTGFDNSIIITIDPEFVKYSGGYSSVSFTDPALLPPDNIYFYDFLDCINIDSVTDDFVIKNFVDKNNNFSIDTAFNFDSLNCPRQRAVPQI